MSKPLPQGTAIMLGGAGVIIVQGLDLNSLLVAPWSRALGQ